MAFLKRLVRARMTKTGEAYTAARLQLLKSTRAPVPDYARLAGMSDAAVSRKTGCTWAQWVAVLDAAHAADKPHAQIAAHVASLGAPSWWAQTVTVGYERIRGLREKGQRRGGGYDASKSRTFGVPVATLFDAFASARLRRAWLPLKVTVRSATPPKRMRLVWTDETIALLEFSPKGPARSAVSVQHGKLPDKAAVQAMKRAWSERFDRLGQLLS